MTRKPVVVVLHGPSGVGKDTVIDELRKRCGVHRATSTTSRLPRKGEVDGIHYHFVTPEAFEAKIAAGDFLEHAWVYEAWKGLEWPEVLGPLGRGQDLVIRTDVQGARTWRGRLEGAITVILVPEDVGALRERLAERGSETEAEVEKRIAEFDAEMADAPNNDYIVKNHKGAADTAVAELAAIIERERANPARPAPRLLVEVPGKASGR